MRWSIPLDMTCITPKGKKIKTLSNTRAFFLKLRKSCHQDQDVLAAVDAVWMAEALVNPSRDQWHRTAPE